MSVKQQKFLEWVESQRDDLGINQKEHIARSNLSHATVWRIENKCFLPEFKVDGQNLNAFANGLQYPSWDALMDAFEGKSSKQTRRVARPEISARQVVEALAVMTTEQGSEFRKDVLAILRTQPQRLRKEIVAVLFDV